MPHTSDSLEGVYLNNLDAGSVLDVETMRRHYRIEYLGGDEIRICGHPSFCPAPVLAKFRGSVRPSGDMQPGFVGRGLRFSFKILTDQRPVITSEIQDIHRQR